MAEEVVEPGSMVSERWAAWRRSIALDAYEQSFADLGEGAHGEADLIESLQPRSVLDAGCGSGRVAIELHRRGIEAAGVDLDPDMIELARQKAPDLRFEVADLATLDVGRTFHVVAMAGNVLLFCRPEDQAPIVARLAAHLEPAGLLVAGFTIDERLPLPAYDAACSAAGLTLLHRWATWSREPFTGGGYAVSVHHL